jgi:hypothetical protein
MKQGLHTIGAAVGLVGMGAVMGYLLGVGTHQLAQAECCAQFGVPFNVQLEQEISDFEREVWRESSYVPQHWAIPSTPAWSNDPCRR